ncbi:hypothetical protein EDE04_7054 [Streptomyces sp. 2132.2]|nr:hypothetical protein EDE04_7054 [Streptomyces sp. 2132.2]
MLNLFGHLMSPDPNVFYNASRQNARLRAAGNPTVV